MTIGPSILEQEDDLKGLPTEALQQMLRQPSSYAPPYLVASELKRREQMGKAHASRQEAGQDQTVANRLAGVQQPIPMSRAGAMGAPPQQPPMPKESQLAMALAGATSQPPPQLPTVNAERGSEGAAVKALIDAMKKKGTETPGPMFSSPERPPPAKPEGLATLIAALVQASSGDKKRGFSGLVLPTKKGPPPPRGRMVPRAKPVRPPARSVAAANGTQGRTVSAQRGGIAGLAEGLLPHPYSDQVKRNIAVAQAEANAAANKDIRRRQAEADAVAAEHIRRRQAEADAAAAEHIRRREAAVPPGAPDLPLVSPQGRVRMQQEAIAARQRKAEAAKKFASRTAGILSPVVAQAEQQARVDARINKQGRDPFYGQENLPPPARLPAHRPAPEDGQPSPPSERGAEKPGTLFAQWPPNFSPPVSKEVGGSDFQRTSAVLRGKLAEPPAREVADVTGQASEFFKTLTDSNKKVFSDLESGLKEFRTADAKDFGKLESRFKALDDFHETGKLPEGMRKDRITNLMLEMSKGLLGSRDLYSGFKVGLEGFQAVDKASRDEYAKGLVARLTASKGIIDSKMAMRNSRRQESIAMTRFAAEQNRGNAAFAIEQLKIAERAKQDARAHRVRMISAEATLRSSDAQIANAMRGSKEERLLKWLPREMYPGALSKAKAGDSTELDKFYYQDSEGNVHANMPAFISEVNRLGTGFAGAAHSRGIAQEARAVDATERSVAAAVTKKVDDLMAGWAKNALWLDIIGRNPTSQEMTNPKERAKLRKQVQDWAQRNTPGHPKHLNYRKPNSSSGQPRAALGEHFGV